MKENILVVGGYGEVGKTVCRDLGKLYPGKVFAAGRRFHQAEKFCRTTGGSVWPFQLDAGKPVDPEILRSTKLVVMCLDQTEPDFVRACLASGVHYIDISASYPFLSQVEPLHDEAAASRATAVLSVGLAPGLTNLLASLVTRQVDRVDAIDMYVLLGLGDQHGKAAIEWTIDNLQSGFTDRKRTDFGDELGVRAAYRFPFADQHVIPRTLGVPAVTTRLCFDSAAVTGFIASCKASGLFQLLQVKPIRAGIVNLFGAIRAGKEVVAVKLDAWGTRGEKEAKVECLLLGKNEAEITGKVAAFVADAVCRRALPNGVYHIEQLFDWEEVWQGVREPLSLELRYKGFI